MTNVPTMVTIFFFFLAFSDELGGLGTYEAAHSFERITGVIGDDVGIKICGIHYGCVLRGAEYGTERIGYFAVAADSYHSLSIYKNFRSV
jgi:hypothetical protein